MSTIRTMRQRDADTRVSIVCAIKQNVWHIGKRAETINEVCFLLSLLDDELRSLHGRPKRW